MIQRIHLCRGSFGSIIRFWILVKKRNTLFPIKHPDLDFNKEMHPYFQVIYKKNSVRQGVSPFSIISIAIQFRFSLFYITSSRFLLIRIEQFRVALMSRGPAILGHIQCFFLHIFRIFLAF